VLGSDTLREFWFDMSKTVLPSWVSPGPRELGSARAGKLSADQWRSTCTIHLVVTLVRLWGNKPKSDRFHLMLQNFLQLVSATKLATMRSVSESQIVDFESTMHQYLLGLRELFPRISISPNQHLSMHLGKILRDFGPAHAWGTWSLERCNHKFQEINTNKRFGRSSHFATLCAICSG
jgi:hypothetical protein